MGCGVVVRHLEMRSRQKISQRHLITRHNWVKLFCVKKWSIPGLFLSFSVCFKKTLQILQQKCPSGIHCWDSNPRPSEHESPPITTRQGLPPYWTKILQNYIRSKKISWRLLDIFHSIEFWQNLWNWIRFHKKSPVCQIELKIFCSLFKPRRWMQCDQ